MAIGLGGDGDRWMTVGGVGTRRTAREGLKASGGDRIAINSWSACGGDFESKVIKNSHNGFEEPSSCKNCRRFGFRN